MFGTPGFPQSGAYSDLQKRVIARLQSANVNDRILEAVQMPFEQAINAENIVISRAERKRLFGDAIKTVLTEMLANLGGAK